MFSRVAFFLCPFDGNRPADPYLNRSFRKLGFDAFANNLTNLTLISVFSALYNSFNSF